MTTESAHQSIDTHVPTADNITTNDDQLAEHQYSDTGLAVLRNALHQPIDELLDLAPLITADMFPNAHDGKIWRAIIDVATETHNTGDTTAFVQEVLVNGHLVGKGEFANDSFRHRWNDVAFPGNRFKPAVWEQFEQMVVILAESRYRGLFRATFGDSCDFDEYTIADIDLAIKHRVDRLRRARVQLSALQNRNLQAVSAPEVA